VSHSFGKGQKTRSISETSGQAKGKNSDSAGAEHVEDVNANLNNNKNSILKWGKRHNLKKKKKKPEKSFYRLKRE